MSTLGSVILEGVFSALPIASIPGRLYFATDTAQTFRDNGTSWDNVTGSGIALEVDGTPNGDQAKLNLVGGTNITLTDDGTGDVTIDASGSGTVTSVGVTVPSRQTVTGSPITGSGTIAITDNTQSANEVFAGPGSGSAAAPTFRAIESADLPVATTSALGVVKPDGTSITISSGVLSSSATAPSGPANEVYATPNGSSGSASLRSIVANDLPTGSSSQLGILKVDGTTITASSGVISAVGGGGSGVTAVTGTLPISSSGGSTPDISVNAATSSSLGVVQPDNSTITISGGVISSTGGGVVIDIPGIGDWIPGFLPGSVTGPPTGIGAFIGTVNQLLVVQFVLPVAITVNNIIITIANAVAASKTAVGVYSSSGNKLVAADNIDSSTTGTKVTSVTSTVLTPGVYYLAQCASSLSVTADSIIYNSDLVTMRNSGTVKRSGSAANPMVSGVLPSTLGTITPAAVFPILTVLES
jgi:hypothetical protein